MKALVLVVSLLTPARSNAADAPKDKTEVVQTLPSEEDTELSKEDPEARKPAGEVAKPSDKMNHLDQGDRLEKPFSRLVFPTDRI